MNRRYGLPSIWREMDQLQREMNRLMESSLRPRAVRPLSFPAINVWTSDDSQVITAELPGFRAEDIDIEVTADTLTLSGERKTDQFDVEMQQHRRERKFGRFSRTIQLPFIVDTNQVEAVLKDGILEISLTRAEVDKPKKITAQSLA